MALTHTSSAIEPTFTPRQREVLQLLVQGRTNSQIAEALGITLDGAKWHVREIITKLGVESREEAAEYWRAHNGLRLRFTRAIRALVPASTWLKIFAGGVGIAAVSAVTIALVVAFQHSPGSSTAAAASTTASPTSTATDATHLATKPALAPPVIPTTVSTPAPTPIPMPTNVQLSAPSGEVVWALVGGEALFRSLDHGTTWTEQKLPDAGTAPVSGPQFGNDHDGWALGIGAPATQCEAQFVDGLWRTNDAGETWTKISPTGIGDRQCKDDPTFTDAKHGFIAAWDPNSQPVIYRTSDAGDSWTASQPLPDPLGQRTSPGGFALRPQNIAQRGDVLLLAAGGWQHTYVYRSDDGGATWFYAATVPNVTDVAQISFVDTNHWLLTGGSLETTDAGQTWGAAPAAPSFAAPIAPQIIFADAQTGYATARGEIQRTLDGGATWQPIHTPGTR
jgi:photosystem II stability/assembly factor-like uncharacterized protein/DNA-binding CsgD family transcriptional regulator